MKEVVLTVIKCPKKRGYSIKHNQPIGWAGTTNYWFAWYKYKSDAIEAAMSLMNSYNRKTINSNE
jgi:hypothetical protein